MDKKDKALLKEGLQDLFYELVAFAIISLVYGLLLMIIWNGTLSIIFTNIPPINYWQSVSLFVFVQVLLNKIGK